MAHRNLDVLDAGERAAELLNELIDQSPRGQLLHVQQMRDSAQSIVANIREGFGRRPGRGRARSLEIARGETEDNRTLEGQLAAQRIGAKKYWPLHNRCVMTAKMLSPLLRR